MLGEIVDEVTRELFLSEAVAYLQEDAADTSEQLAVREAVSRRLDFLDANFLTALSGFIRATEARGDAALAKLLTTIRTEVLSQVSGRMPLAAQVLDRVVREMDRDVRLRILREAVSEHARKLPDGVPGADLDTLSATASKFIDEMEDQREVPDRRLLARLCLVREELRLLREELRFTGGAAADGLPPEPVRSNVPQRCAAFLKELVAVGDPLRRVALLSRTLEQDWDGAAPRQKPQTSFQADQPDWVRPGRFLATLQSMVVAVETEAAADKAVAMAASASGKGGGAAADAAPPGAKQAPVLQRLEAIRAEALSVLDRMQAGSGLGAGYVDGAGAPAAAGVEASGAEASGAGEPLEVEVLPGEADGGSGNGEGAQGGKPPAPDAEAEARTAGPSRRHPDEVVDRGLREALLAAYGLQGQLAPDAPVLLVDLAAVKRSARNIRNANHCPPALVDYTGREFVVFARLPPKPGQAPGPGPGPARAPAGAAASGAGTGTGAYGGAAGAASAGGAGIIRVAPLAVCRQLKPGEAGDRRAAEGVVGAFRHATRLGAFKTQRRSANKTVPGATPLKTAGLTYAVYTRTSVPGLYAHQLGRPDREDAMVGVLRAVTGVLDAQHAPHMRMLRAYGRGHEYHGKGTGPFCTLSYTSNYHNRLHVDQDDPPLSFITWWLEGAGALRGGAFRLANLRIRFTPLQGTTLLLNTKELLHGTEACAPVPGRSGVRRIGAALWVREAVVHAWRQWRAGAMARYRERVGASGVRDRAKAIRKACEFAEKEVAKQGTGAAAERARVMREGARRMPAFCGDLFDEGAVRAAWGLWDVRTVQASAPARKPVAV
ncbi:hypothetical protein HYH03_008328 [Edaphochlamys debaryana]|uniref:Uncharacterized protein n=1 Tax=Edaphochlamys debaryana TaxID=47281 RepID=A0A836BZ22_9CHLO|nr:hypothetical protein HYH03_008328 [Edaphochlamys debaryana]|eukprot:KAG2493512.1 hypothetical protein HYH03_008328 [Edaphochlamys debaryana]